MRVGIIVNKYDLGDDITQSLIAELEEYCKRQANEWSKDNLRLSLRSIQLFEEKVILGNKVEKLEKVIVVLKVLVDEIGHCQPHITAECLKEVDRIETSN